LEKDLSKIGDIKIKVKANEKGHLFAGVGKEEIGNASGIPVGNIILETPLKEVGEHDIEIKIGEKNKKIKVVLEAE
jgi:ribosomal protein L9